MAKCYPYLSSTLKTLLYEQRLSLTDLANKVNLPLPTVHRLVTGKTKRPYRNSLIPIAEYFSITIEQLLGEEPIEESKLKREIKSSGNILPVHKWSELNDVFYPSISNAVEPQAGQKRLFALIQNDDSMIPLFPEGTELIFNSSIKSHDKSFVLAYRASTGDFLFRQLLVDDNHRFLKPLNPDPNTYKMSLLDTNDCILATLQESRIKHVNDNNLAVGNKL